MTRYFLTFITPLLLIACEPDNDDSIARPDQHTRVIQNTINLNELKNGQQNYYLRFTADCSDHNGTFQYTGDTLVLSVNSKDNDLLFYEEFTPNSTNMGGLEPSETYVFSKNDYLLLPDRQLSYLFFFYGNDTIHLTKPEDINLSQGDCYIEYLSGEPFIGEEIGYLPTFEYQDINLINNRIVSCVPIFFDMDAYLIYDQTQLKMTKMLFNNLSNSSIEGYVLLQ